MPGSSRNAWTGFALMFACLLAASPAAAQQVAQEEYPYPQGNRFPLGLYSLEVETPEELDAVKGFGWNIGHTYGKQLPLLETLAPARLFAFARLEQETEAAAEAEIAQLSGYDSVAWWDLPEERRWWREDEFTLIKNLSAWTRKYDPKQRPNFMYIPGHYDIDDVAHYVPYLDIIGTGAYTEYHRQPRAWVRWRIEAQIEAIHKAGFQVGRDYLHRERVPIAVLMCFQQGRYEAGRYVADLSEHDVITPVEAYHDFYCALASGARGVLVFSYYHRNDLDVLRSTFETYSKAASEISGSELGQALLFGKEAPITVEITKGPQRTPPFRPAGLEQDIGYPAVNARATQYQGHLYILAVNSAEFAHALRAVLRGVPEQAEQAQVMFENRTVAIRNGELEDDFGWLGIHVYKVALTQ